MCFRFILTAILLAALVAADKDSDYYGPSKSNPNEKKSHYWKEAFNVLEDLSEFDKLYVRYHNCAWTPIVSNGQDDHDENGMCGSDGGDGEDHWYLGSTPCLRANVAYSLYGILKGEKDGGCTSKTFINSFFTTAGLVVFGQALSLKGEYLQNYVFGGDEEEVGGGDTSSSNGDGGWQYISSTCMGGNDEEDNHQDESADDLSHGQLFYPEETSYGVTCKQSKFVRAEFQGSYCSNQQPFAVINELSHFNKDMNDIECALIFDSSLDEYNYQYNGEENDQEIEIEYAVDLLKVSSACSIRGYPLDCPDPYGKVKAYTRTLEGATKSRARTIQSKAVGGGFALWMLISGLILAVVSCGMDGRRHTKGEVLEPYFENVPVARDLSLVSLLVVRGVKENTLEAVESFREFAEQEVGEEESLVAMPGGSLPSKQAQDDKSISTKSSSSVEKVKDGENNATASEEELAPGDTNAGGDSVQGGAIAKPKSTFSWGSRQSEALSAVEVTPAADDSQFVTMDDAQFVSSDQPSVDDASSIQDKPEAESDVKEANMSVADAMLADIAPEKLTKSPPSSPANDEVSASSPSKESLPNSPSRLSIASTFNKARYKRPMLARFSRAVFGPKRKSVKRVKPIALSKTSFEI